MSNQIVQVESDSITFERVAKSGQEGYKFRLNFDAHDKADFDATLDKAQRLNDWFKSSLLTAVTA